LEITKRDGRNVVFDRNKIIRAIDNSMRDTIKGADPEISSYVAEQVEEILEGHVNITVEDIQDLIETLLMETPRKDVAKTYILYRANRNQSRNKRNQNKFALLTDDFISNYKHKKPPMDELGLFTFYRTYSRFLPEEGRREAWYEVVKRAVEYNCSLAKTSVEEAKLLYDNVFHLKQFLSGRSFYVGGTKVTDKYPMANFNCSFTIIDSVKAFRDLFYLLMLGSGVGFRVLQEDAKKLPSFKTNVQLIHKDYTPQVKNKRIDLTSLKFLDNNTVEIVIGDSKEGWSDSLYYYLNICTDKRYREVNKIIVNYDNVRPKGERLNTFGGTASGYESIKTMLYKINKIIYKENGIMYRKLEPIDLIDIANAIGENVVIGGVRRTSQIALISPNDIKAIKAKNDLYVQEGATWVENTELSHRKMSNNTIFYEEKPTRDQLHWHLQQLRQSGEPGFLNAENARERLEIFEGTNPCAEILLPSKGLCNLTTVNVFSFIENNKLNFKKLHEAMRLSVRAAYRMSTVELELHDWDVINKENKLIGCSLTGYQDMVSALKLSREEQQNLLLELWQVAFDAAEDIALELDDKQPLLITTNKPEGSLSLVAGVSSGLHHAHSPYYIRRVRINARDPLVQVCELLEYPIFPEVGQTLENCSTKVIEFPCKSAASRTKYDVSAIEQLETYKLFMSYYTDHNSSITITVKNDEWEAVEDWVYENWDEIVGISFLSLDDSFYSLMPYEQITEEEYLERKRNMKPFIPSLLSKYEQGEVEFDIGSMSDCDHGMCSIR